MTMHRLVSRLSSPTPHKSEHTPKSWSKQPMALLICGQTRYRELISCARDTGHQPSSLLPSSTPILSHPCPNLLSRLLGPTSLTALCPLSSVLAIPSPSLPDPNQLPRAEPFHMSWYRTSQYKPLPPGKGHIQDGHKNKKDVKTPSNSSSRASSVIPIVVSRNQFDSSKTRAGINVKAGSGGEVKLRPSMPVASMPGAS